jgi:hypothetical protein
MPAPIDPNDELHRVQLKVPRKLYDHLVSYLRDGETVSSLTRELYQREVSHRAIELLEQRELEEKQRERRKRSKPPAPQ